MDKKALKIQTLPDLIIGHVEELITSGELKEGDKLPTERELMGVFDVGRTSIREALKALSTLGVVERTKEGTFVRDISGFFLSPITKEIIVRKSNLKELWEARKILEVGLSGLAAKHITDMELDLLQKHVEEMKKHMHGDPDKFIQGDIAFHHVLAEGAQNHVLLNIFLGVRDMVAEAQKKFAVLPAVKERAYNDHIDILNAVSVGDKEKSEKAMWVHLKIGEDYLEEIK